MPLFDVACRDQSTGSEYVIQCVANAGSGAIALAQQAGHSPVRAEPSQVQPLESASLIDDDLRIAIKGTRADVALCASSLRAISDCRFTRAPMSTIGWGIILAIVFWVFIVIMLWIALAVLGISLAAFSRAIP